MLLVSSCVKILFVDKAVLNWIKSSDYDLATAAGVLKTKHYVYVIFFCHLAIEKLLKALVAKITKRIPPKTHDLLLLLRLSDIDLPEKYQILIARLNSVSIPTRYPDDISKLARQYNRAAADRYLKEATNFLRWLKQSQKLAK